MKHRIFYKLLFTVFAVFFAADLMAQVPQGFNFQAVARGNDGLPLSSQQVGVEVNIVKGSEAGDVVYTESHTITTSVAGLIQIVIGEGTPAENNNFSSIDWSNDNYYVNLGMDTQGGTSYEDLGTTRLLSVPYALLAENVVNGSGGSGDGGVDDVITIDTNDPNQQDSLKIVRLGNEAETEIAYGLQIEGSSTGRNRPLSAVINELAANTASQYAISGTASGPGSGTHIGMLGTAWNPDATGGDRYGVYGQANSQGKYNYGALGAGFGAGNGDEGFGFGEGSINFGLYGLAGGNTWSNTGLEARTTGEAGRVNVAVNALSGAGITDSTLNYGVRTFANGPGVNYGIHASAFDGVENWAAFFEGAVKVNGNIDIAGDLSATTVTQTSDERYKKNIETLNNALHNTLKLRGVSYNWIDESKGEADQIGVIAQEVEEIYPEFVHTDDDGMKSVNYAQMTAVLIEAVKELNAKIESLETENADLQAKVDTQNNLEQRLAEIEKLLNLNRSVQSAQDVSADK